MKVTREEVLDYFEKTFPEKYLQLYDIPFTDENIQKFIDEEKIEWMMFFNVNKFLTFIVWKPFDVLAGVNRGPINPITKLNIGSSPHNNPITGQLFYNTTKGNFNVYDGNSWQEFH